MMAREQVLTSGNDVNKKDQQEQTKRPEAGNTSTNKVLFHFDEVKTRRQSEPCTVITHSSFGQVDLVLQPVTSSCESQSYPENKLPSDNMTKTQFQKKTGSNLDENKLLETLSLSPRKSAAGTAEYGYMDVVSPADEELCQQLTENLKMLKHLKCFNDFSNGQSYHAPSLVSSSPKNMMNHGPHNTEARMVHRKTADGVWVKEDVSTPPYKLSQVQTLSSLSHQLVQSGAMTILGSCDLRGGAIICVSCKSSIWEHQSTHELAQFLLYLCHLPREFVRGRGATVIVEARGTNLATLNKLLEMLYTVHATDYSALFIVHVLADKVVQALLFRTPYFKPHINLRINIVTTAETLKRFVTRDALPVDFGGQSKHKHGQLFQVLQELEPFLERCRAMAHQLLSLLRSVRASEEEDLLLKLSCTHPEMLQVEEAGTRHLAALKALVDSNKHFLYSDLYERTSGLYNTVRDGRKELTEYIQHRQCQLQNLAHTHQQLVSWFCDDGETILKRYESPSDSLQGIRAQRLQLQLDCQLAQTHISKAQELKDEAERLTGSQEQEQVTGLRAGSRELMDRVYKYNQRLETTSNLINNHAQCIELLDQCYEWAMHTSQLVGSINVGLSPTVQSIEAAQDRVTQYLQQNSPPEDDIFTRICQLADMLDSAKLRERCSTAQQRCSEAQKLLQHRQLMLTRTKEQLKSRPPMSPSSPATLSPTVLGGVKYREPHHIRSLHNTASSTSLHYNQFNSPYQHSLHTLAEHRRRSYAGKPSGPIYSPSAAAFKENLLGMDFLEYEEQLFQEGLITEDMSDRIVTSLPKGLSDSTLRGSRESLRGSTENVDEESSSQPRPQSTISSVLNISLNRHGRPLRKMKRVGSCNFPDKPGEAGENELYYERPLSLLTAAQSTDSLPSLPEDEALDTSAQSEHRRGWVPLPSVPRDAQHKVHSQSMSDLRVAEEDVHRRRQLQLVMHELIQTERDYVKSLQYIIDNYMSELSKDSVPQPLRGKRNIIFGNLEKIHQFHCTQFLSELEACVTNPYNIGQCFLRHMGSFYLYALYNKNKPRSDTLMHEHGCQFFAQRQQQLKDKMDLNSYLLKPVQRIGKYALLLKQVLKLCPVSEHEFPVLKEALDMVKFQLRHGNDLLALDCLTGSDVNLQEQGMLLRQETFLVYHGRHKALRQVFLFEEMLVLSKAKRNSAGKEVYSYKNSLKTSDLGLTENVGDNQYKFEIWFRKRTGNDTYTLQNPSLEVKQEWVREISRLLWKQAIKNRERRLTEAAQMGSGGKPCIDLKPSKDNIHDRFVNISLSNRVPKARSSVAVGSVDYQRGTAGKRPHSLISLSSTSSSSSSGLQPSTLCITFESPLENSHRNTSTASADGLEDATTQTTLPRSSRADSADSRPLSLLEMDPHELLRMTDV